MVINLLHKTFEISGLAVGLWVFVIIILARWLCIWGEYHFSKKFWIFFFVVGTIAVISSLFVQNVIISTMLSALGFIFIWGIHETIEQEKRVEKGWFPKKNKVFNEQEK